MHLDLRRAADRPVTPASHRTGGIRTEHSFSFGGHYDPANVGFGLLVAHNDEHLPIGGGYADHPHRDTEIVTVVLEGTLRHDSGVGSGEVGAGGVQRLSAGSGVVHAETAAGEGPVRFVQTWLRPDAPGLPPSYAVGETAWDHGCTPLVGGDGAVGVGASARLYAVALSPGGALALPDAPRLHLFVVDGDLTPEGLGTTAGPADALRLTDAGEIAIRSATGARALLWASA